MDSKSWIPTICYSVHTNTGSVYRMTMEVNRKSKDPYEKQWFLRSCDGDSILLIGDEIPQLFEKDPMRWVSEWPLRDVIETFWPKEKQSNERPSYRFQNN